MKRVIAASLMCGLLCACDSGEADPEIAKAVSQVKNSDRAKAYVNAEGRMAELKKKAEADAEAAKAKAYADLIKVPSTVPSDLATACSDVAQALDSFKSKRLEGTNLERWNVVKQRDMDKLAQTCRARGNLHVAACQAHALQQASPMFSDEEGTHLLTQCEEKLASAGGKNNRG